MNKILLEMVFLGIIMIMKFLLELHQKEKKIILISIGVVFNLKRILIKTISLSVGMVFLKLPFLVNILSPLLLMMELK